MPQIQYRMHHRLTPYLSCTFTFFNYKCYVMLMLFIEGYHICYVYVHHHHFKLPSCSSSRRIILGIHDHHCPCLPFLSCLINLTLLGPDPSPKLPFSVILHLCILFSQYQKGQIFCQCFHGYLLLKVWESVDE